MAVVELSLKKGVIWDVPKGTKILKVVRRGDEIVVYCQVPDDSILTMYGKKVNRYYTKELAVSLREVTAA
jgi:hypothetical protein